LRGIERLPGYLRPTLEAPLRQLSLLDNTYGARVFDVVGYEVSKKLIRKGFKELYGALWRQFERDTRNGIIPPVFAPTLGGQYAGGGYGGSGGGSWGGPPSGGK
jgi:hypothetical protein